ncbi:MAG: hypothetical protein GXO74_00560 [Calditrichaeota bacterium]|nr:hypothetical protein [Calditrichota bacterium]
MANEKRRASYEGHRGKPDRSNLSKIDRILIDIQKRLRDSIESVSIENLNGYERKRIHSFFDDRDDFETKSYRRNGQIVLKVFPVGNLKKFAREKAGEVLATGQTYIFPPLPGYERYIIHNCLQDFDGVETASEGEGESRRLEIRPVKFGRSLKRIMKKIRIF